MENEKTEKKYSGYGYHGGGRKKKADKKIFVNTTISGTPEEISRLKEAAKKAGKTVSRLVLDSLLEEKSPQAQEFWSSPLK